MRITIIGIAFKYTPYIIQVLYKLTGTWPFTSVKKEEYSIAAKKEGMNTELLRAAVCWNNFTILVSVKNGTKVVLELRSKTIDVLLCIVVLCDVKRNIVSFTTAHSFDC